MSREVDQSDFTANTVPVAREAEFGMGAAEANARLPGNQTVTITSFDPATGNAAVEKSEAASSDEANDVARALDFLQDIKPALGFAPTQPVEFQADPRPTD